MWEIRSVDGTKDLLASFVITWLPPLSPKDWSRIIFVLSSLSQMHTTKTGTSLSIMIGSNLRTMSLVEKDTGNSPPRHPRFSLLPAFTPDSSRCTKCYHVTTLLRSFELNHLNLGCVWDLYHLIVSLLLSRLLKAFEYRLFWKIEWGFEVLEYDSWLRVQGSICLLFDFWSGW